MIPKIIWQTYKDPIDTLPHYAKSAIQSWKDMNPEYEHRYMDDQQAGDFVKSEYGKEIYDFFINVPVGVMRGDMWRYLIIYKFGGIYTDLDTMCLSPVRLWMKEDKEMIVCPEHQDHFCQWTFAASPNHPVIKKVIDVMIERLKNADYTQHHFVHQTTGPAMWTTGIYEALELEGVINPAAEYNPNEQGLIVNSKIINESQKAQEYGFYCYGGDEWRIFHWQAVKHIYGSQEWKDGGYVQWIQDPLVKRN